MSNPAWIEVIGFTAACLTTSSFLPQALKIWRNRSARDVSLVMYLMMCSGSSLWLAYGVLIASPALIVANCTGLTLVVWILGLKLREVIFSRA
jgi:MtN3 and saliva related transmembrane protein